MTRFRGHPISREDKGSIPTSREPGSVVAERHHQVVSATARGGLLPLDLGLGVGLDDRVLPRLEGLLVEVRHEQKDLWQHGVTYLTSTGLQTLVPYDEPLVEAAWPVEAPYKLVLATKDIAVHEWGASEDAVAELEKKVDGTAELGVEKRAAMKRPSPREAETHLAMASLKRQASAVKSLENGLPPMASAADFNACVLAPPLGGVTETGRPSTSNAVTV